MRIRWTIFALSIFALFSAPALGAVLGTEAREIDPPPGDPTIPPDDPLAPDLCKLQPKPPWCA